MNHLKEFVDSLKYSELSKVSELIRKRETYSRVEHGQCWKMGHCIYLVVKLDPRTVHSFESVVVFGEEYILVNKHGVTGSPKPFQGIEELIDYLAEQGAKRVALREFA